MWEFVRITLYSVGSTKCVIGADGVLSDWFTIRAVSQDDFEDVKVPDAPAQSPQPGASTIVSAVAAK